MRSKPVRRMNDRRRTSRHSAGLSPEERRRLLQMGASLAVFLLAILGRSAFPQKMDLWNDFLHKDINLNAALTRFEEATEQGEPFMDALGELCMEVFTAGESQSADQEQEMADNSGENMREYTAERAERWNAWEEFRESQWHSK